MMSMCAAVLVAPFTVVMVLRTMIGRWRPSRTETVLVAMVGGLAAALALGLPHSVFVLPLAALGPAAAIVDLYERRLPDALTGPMVVGAVLFAAGSGAAGLRGIAVAVCATAAVLVVKVVAPAAIGWGDIKLTPTVAVVLGQADVAAAGLVVILAGIAVTSLVVAAADRHGDVPYGPAMVLGSLTAVALV